MATNTIHVSDELLAELQAKAQAEGKSVDELAEEALRKGLEDRAWQDLLDYGRETAIIHEVIGVLRARTIGEDRKSGRAG